MTKKEIVSTNNNEYLITPSLLNSWLYIDECTNGMQSNENDTISLEDKMDDARQKAFEDFLNTLNRIPSTPNKYMQEGLDFEDACYRGKTCISPIIKNGQFQIVGTKHKEVCGIKFLLYGRLDVLKGGIIYDIKRIWKYYPQKYLWSSQHKVYLELFPDAYEFQYLCFDGRKLHIETYYRNDGEVDIIIEQFISWLKANNLFEIYQEKWKCKY